MANAAGTTTITVVEQCHSLEMANAAGTTTITVPEQCHSFEMANAAGTATMITVVEQCRISPPLDHSCTENILPLTFSDLQWLNIPSTCCVYYYCFPCSTTEFKQTLVPQLKKSLALALEHYFPFCGNLIIPTNLSNNTVPAIHYLKGNSVTLTVAEFTGTASSKGFEHLSANHARDVGELLSLVPELPKGDIDTFEDDTVLISPVLSVQVTWFPDQGFSLGFRKSHLVADGKTMLNFVATWAFINAKQLKSESDYEGANTLLPSYDRSLIKDTKGLASIFLNHGLRIAEEISKASVPAAQKIDLVQATLMMNRTQIQALKDSVLAKLPYVSTFIVVCAYVWTCLAKASIASQGQEINDKNQVKEHLIIAMDFRARLDPPLHPNYFGNAISPCWTTLETSRLVGPEGFGYAVEEIKKALHEQINNEEGVLKGFDTFFDHFEATKGQKMFAIAGSLKFDYYSADFGWGKPKKYEFVSEKLSLVKSGDMDGDLEIVLCFSKKEMDAFTTIFNQGLIK